MTEIDMPSIGTVVYTQHGYKPKLVILHTNLSYTGKVEYVEKSDALEEAKLWLVECINVGYITDR